jgi:hypothetical protein
MMTRVKPIEVDLVETWPSELVDLIAASRDDLNSWKQREDEIDQLRRGDVLARYTHQPNASEEVMGEFVEAVDQLLGRREFRVRHCTRLIGSDIAALRTEGMVPLSADHQVGRLSRACTEGHLTSEQLERLLDHSDYADGRLGSTHWIFGRTPLSNQWDVGRLLGHWGGEALYNAQPEDLRSLLASMGTPAIVVASIPWNQFDSYFTLGELFRDAIVRNRLPELEARTSEVVPAAMIERVLLRGDEEFEHLTRASAWLHD